MLLVVVLPARWRAFLSGAFPHRKERSWLKVAVVAVGKAVVAVAKGAAVVGAKGAAPLAVEAKVAVAAAKATVHQVVGQVLPAILLVAVEGMRLHPRRSFI